MRNYRRAMEGLPGSSSSGHELHLEKGKGHARNPSTESQNDDSVVGRRIGTGSTVARDVDTTASSGPRVSYEKERALELEESRPTSTSESGPSNVSVLQNPTENAYGGGLYGSDEGTILDRDSRSRLVSAESNNYLAAVSRASDSQSVEGGPGDFYARHYLDLPTSSGDRDLEVTGQSYIG